MMKQVSKVLEAEGLKHEVITLTDGRPAVMVGTYTGNATESFARIMWLQKRFGRRYTVERRGFDAGALIYAGAPYAGSIRR